MAETQAMKRFMVTVDGKDYEVSAPSAEALPEIVDTISNTGKPGIERAISKGMEMASNDLVPDIMSEAGSAISKFSPEKLRPGLKNAADAAKKMAIPGFAGYMSGEIVDKPMQSLMTTGVALPIVAAAEVGGPALAINAAKPIIGSIVGGQIGGSIGGPIADFFFGEGQYTNTGSLVGGLLLGSIGLGVGKGMQMNPAKAKYYKDMIKYNKIKNSKQLANKIISESGGKEAFQQGLANNADDIVKNIREIDKPLTEAYYDMDMKHFNKRTNISIDDVNRLIPDEFKDEVIPLNKRTYRVKKGTSGPLVDSSGKTIPRKLNFREVFNLSNDIQKLIDKKLYKGEGASDLIRTKKVVDTALNRARGPVDRIARKGLNKQFKEVHRIKRKLLKQLGYDYDSQSIDTTKLDKVLSDKGDVSVKAFIKTAAELDDAVKSGIDVHKIHSETLKQSTAVVPKKPIPPAKTSGGIGRDLIKVGGGAATYAGANWLKRKVTGM